MCVDGCILIQVLGVLCVLTGFLTSLVYSVVSGVCLWKRVDDVTLLNNVLYSVPFAMAILTNMAGWSTVVVWRRKVGRQCRVRVQFIHIIFCCFCLITHIDSEVL